MIGREDRPSPPTAAAPTGTRRQRIAHLQLLPLLSGVQKVSLDELIRLDRRQFEPYLICRSPGPLTEAAAAHGIPCLFADQLVRPISPYRDWRAFWQLYRLMRTHRFDVVHTHSSKTGVLGRLAARAAGVPCIVHTCHGFAFPATASWWRKALYFVLEWLGARCCNATVYLKQADLQFARKWLAARPDRCRLIPNGVDARQYRPLAAGERERLRQEELGLDAGQLAVGMVGRLSPQKDPLCFVAAADLALREGIAAKFFLIGDGELRAEVEAEIQRRGRAGQIAVLGWRDDAARVVAALDLFVLTSRWEGLSLAVLEALACGVPVVASDIPGNRDLICAGSNGLLAGVNDAAAFAAQIGHLLRSHGLRHDYGVAARLGVERDYRLDARIRRLAGLYSQYATTNGALVERPYATCAGPRPLTTNRTDNRTPRDFGGT